MAAEPKPRPRAKPPAPKAKTKAPAKTNAPARAKAKATTNAPARAKAKATVAKTTKPRAAPKPRTPRVTPTPLPEPVPEPPIVEALPAPFETPVEVAAPPARARLGQRAGAFVLDWIVIGIGQFAVTGVLSALVDALSPPDLGPADTAMVVYDATFTLISLVALALPGLYFGVLHGGPRGQSLGQRATGIRVVRRDGRPVGVLRAVLRAYARILSALPFGLGFWSSAWHPDGDTWHDRMAGTHVVAATEVRDAASSRRTRGLVLAVPALVFAIAFASLVAATNAVHHPKRGPIESLRPGTCGIVPVADADWMRVTPCADAHDFEVVVVIDHPAGPYHVGEIDELAEERCASAVARYVDSPLEDTSVGYDYIAPDERAWGRGDRTTTCYAWAPDFWLEGSVRERGPDGSPTGRSV